MNIQADTRDIIKIRIELCKMNCRVHLRLPEIIRNGDELIYKTCCDEFTKILEKKYDQLVNALPANKVAGKYH
jgi:hypothetical protein